MRKRIQFFTVLGLLLGLGVSTNYFLHVETPVDQVSILKAEVDDVTKAKVAQDYGQLPLHFEPNVGQMDDRVDFVSRGQGYALFLTDGEAVLTLARSSVAKGDADQSGAQSTQSDVVCIQLIDANVSSSVFGTDSLSGKSNYLLGNDASQWHTDVPHYGKVQYDDVYPGIDLVYYGTEQRLLEHDFVVSPGADPDVIRFSVAGAESLVLDNGGNLVASTEGGDVVLQAPITYQEIDGERISIASEYALVDDTVGFKLASYDVDHVVVIDPVLSYSTYLGGSGKDNGNAIALDNSGNIYVAGRTLSTDYPSQSPFQSTHGGSTEDVFVSVLNSSGSGLIYSTYLGGSADERGAGIAVDGSGNAYVTGYTNSPNYPVFLPYQATKAGGTWDAFVTVLNNTGSNLIYSTYLGGNGNDFGGGIAINGSGNAYVTGETNSSNFPVHLAYQATQNNVDEVFVTVFNNTGSGLVYSTYLGGNSTDAGKDIVVDGSGNAYVTGFTESTNFPLASPIQGSNGGANDVFVSVLNASGSNLVYSTYLGGSADDYGLDIAIDGSGNAYVTGKTASTNYPLQSAFQPTFGGGTDDVFVSAINSLGSALIYSTYLGGTSEDRGHGIAVDDAGNAFVTGLTISPNFPLQSAYQGTQGGSYDVFISVLNNAGSNLILSTYLGGAGFDQGSDIAIDGSANAYVTGNSASTDYPLQSAFQPTFGGGDDDAFVSKMSINLGVSIPDTVAMYGTQILVPIRVENPSLFGVVAAEISIAYDNSVVTPDPSDETSIVGTLVASGWSVEDNVFSGVGGIDTLTIAMSTAADTLSNAGDLIHLVFNVADVRHPASTSLQLVKVLFNDGEPLPFSTDGSLAILGTDGVISTSPDSINPADVVNVTVTDTDFDIDVGSADQVTVTAVSKLYGDTQTVALTETGVNTGIFTGTVNTAFALAAGPSEDGVIGTIAGDSICVSVVDSLDASGVTVTRLDTVEVVGGVDGVVAVSYVVQAFDGRNGIRDTVRVRVTDVDLDVDVGVAEQVSATITNAISGEVEGVTLTETGVNTGVFQVRVPTIAGASGTNNDGALSLASWDTLNVSYDDALSSQGGLNVVSDITRVVNVFGDVQVNDQVQAFDAARLLAISVGLVSANTQTTLVGDVDGGGAIGAFDAALVLRYVVRLIDRFDVQTDTNINLPSDPKNHPFLKPVVGDVIALGDMNQQADGTYLVPVKLAEREGVVSGLLTFGVDAGIEVVDVEMANAYGSFMIAHNTTDEGVKVAFAGSQSELSGSGDVLMLRVRGVEGTPIRLSLDQVSLNGQSLTPSVNIEAMETVETPASAFITELHQNLPNPFNPQTTIRYGLSDAGQVSVVVYSVTGQRVRTLVSAFQASGAYQVTWDGLDALGNQVSSGVYLMRMQTGGFIQTRKMLLLR